MKIKEIFKLLVIIALASVAVGITGNTMYSFLDWVVNTFEIEQIMTGYCVLCGIVIGVPIYLAKKEWEKTKGTEHE